MASLVVFQNCEGMGVDSTGSKSTTAASRSGGGGNGDGYDGKLFVNVDLSRLCPLGDKNIIRVTLDNRSFLLRESCVDLSQPVEIDPATYFRLISDASVLVRDVVYEEYRPEALTRPIIACRGNFNKFGQTLQTAELQIRNKMGDRDLLWIRQAFITPFGIIRYDDAHVTHQLEADGTDLFTMTFDPTKPPPELQTFEGGFKLPLIDFIKAEFRVYPKPADRPAWGLWTFSLRPGSPSQLIADLFNSVLNSTNEEISNSMMFQECYRN